MIITLSGGCVEMEQCRLCQCDDVPLKESHIVSKMFFNSIKKKSLTGIMRRADDPNRGIQDGLKLPFLCGNCEELFSKYERAFSNTIYQKAITNDGDIQFDSNDEKLSYFLLSIAWRVIKYTQETDKTTFTERELIKIDEVIELWRKILKTEDMDEIQKVQQFIIPTKNLTFFENIPFRIYDNVLMDFKTYDEEDTFKFSFTIVQVPYFIFITTVWGYTDSMKQYRLGSIIKPRKSKLPKDITNCLSNLHYEKFFEANEKMTERQRKLIEDRVKKYTENRSYRPV